MNRNEGVNRNQYTEGLISSKLKSHMKNMKGDREYQ